MHIVTSSQTALRQRQISYLSYEWDRLGPSEWAPFGTMHLEDIIWTFLDDDLEEAHKTVHLDMIKSMVLRSWHHLLHVNTVSAWVLRHSSAFRSSSLSVSTHVWIQLYIQRDTKKYVVISASGRINCI